MSNRSVGTPVVSAIIHIRKGDEVTSTAVAKDDKLTNLTIGHYPEDIVLDSATVKGFTLKSLQMPRGSCTIYDGIPTYMPDPDGGSFFRLAEETTEIDKIVVEVEPETEGDDVVAMTIPVCAIKSFEGGTPVESGDDTKEPEGSDPSKDPGTNDGKTE